MLLYYIWNFFTYVFRIAKRDRTPEYLKVDDDIEYHELQDIENLNFTF